MSSTRIQITAIESKALAVCGNDIDTDRIIPARFMKCVTFEGLGQYAFHDVRHDAQGQLTDHPFNRPDGPEAAIMIVNQNFGCGSSREHAPQALNKFGIRALIGESFAEIFAGNCSAMGIIAVTAKQADVRALQELAVARPASHFRIDLKAMTASCPEADFSCPVSMPEAYRLSLLQGTWDSTGVLLEHQAAIGAAFARIPYLAGF